MMSGIGKKHRLKKKSSPSLSEDKNQEYSIRIFLILVFTEDAIDFWGPFY